MTFSSAKTSMFLFANVLLVAMTLFVVGPQLGSLDADGDGIPEVPIIISTPSSAIVNPSHAAAVLHSLTKDLRTSVMAVVVSSFVTAPNEFGCTERQLLQYLSGFVLHPFVLRC